MTHDTFSVTLIMSQFAALTSGEGGVTISPVGKQDVGSDRGKTNHRTRGVGIQ